MENCKENLGEANSATNSTQIPNQRKRKSSPLTGSKENKAKCLPKYQSLKKISSNPRLSFSNDQMMKDLGVGLLEDIPSSKNFPSVKIQNNAVTHKKSKVTHFDECAQDFCSLRDNESLEISSGSDFLRCRNRGTYAEDHSCKISDEVLLDVFKWLPKHTLVICAQTCKRWKRLSLDEILWKRVDASRKLLRVGVVGDIVIRGVQALRMSMTEISSPLFLNEEVLNAKIRFSKLKYLDFSMAAISTEGLNQLLSVCGELRKISLEKCHLDDTTCFHLSRNSHLHTLNVALCRGLSHKGVNYITSGCRYLIECNVAWVDLDKETATEMMQNLPLSLKKLNISGMHSALTDDGIEDLTVSCPNIEELDISDCSELTAESLKHITSKLMRLRVLAVNRCLSITPNDYLMLKNMRALEFLEIYGILSPESLQTFKNHLIKINVNKTLFSTIARPTIGNRRTSIWGIRVRD